MDHSFFPTLNHTNFHSLLLREAFLAPDQSCNFFLPLFQFVIINNLSGTINIFLPSFFSKTTATVKMLNPMSMNWTEIINEQLKSAGTQFRLILSTNCMDKLLNGLRIL